MPGPTPFIDFFVLEASDYIEQLDGLLLSGGQSGPDAETMQRLARSLRGAATMAKLRSFADAAAGLERMARALHDGSMHWDPGIGAALIAAVDDLKLLLHNARNWTSADDDRAARRSAELSRLAPATVPAAPVPTSPAGLAFFATEVSNIAAGLKLVAARPDARTTAGQVLKRLRALRGVAGIQEIPGLVDVLDATDEAAQPLERGQGRLSAESTHVLETAAVLMLCIASELRDGKAGDPNGGERAAFSRAVDEWFDHEVESEPVVPISDLYFTDQGPHVVSTAAHPPTSAEERYRLELVSRGENLRGLVHSARDGGEAGSGPSPARSRRGLRRALIGIASVTRSFGDLESTQLVEAIAREMTPERPVDLGAIDRLATTLADRGPHRDRLSIRLSGAHLAHALLAPAAEAADAARSMVSIDIDAGIAAIARLTEEPFFAPAPLPQNDVVAIDSLLYRGRAALTRAIEIRDVLRSPGAGVPPADALGELFDLLDLALTD